MSSDRPAGAAPTLQAHGVVVPGHGVASGRAPDSPFAAGTIALQTPHLARQGIDLSAYHPATMNVDVSPFALHVLDPRWTATDIAWTDVHPAETFSFVQCRLTAGGRDVDALVYYPHPETKPGMNHQPRSVVEVLAPFVPGLGYGDEVSVELAQGQAVFDQLPE